MPGGAAGAVVGAIACVFTSGPAILAGIGALIGGLAMAQHGMQGMADDINNLSRNTDNSGNVGNQVGDARETKVADLIGGRRTKELTNNGQDFPIVMPGVGPSGVDVFGPNGEYIAVGGSGKALRLDKLGKQMKILEVGGRLPRPRHRRNPRPGIVTHGSFTGEPGADREDAGVRSPGRPLTMSSSR